MLHNLNEYTTHSTIQNDFEKCIYVNTHTYTFANTNTQQHFQSKVSTSVYNLPEIPWRLNKVHVRQNETKRKTQIDFVLWNDYEISCFFGKIVA